MKPFVKTNQFKAYDGRLDWFCCGRRFRYQPGDLLYVHRRWGRKPDLYRVDSVGGWSERDAQTSGPPFTHYMAVRLNEDLTLTLTPFGTMSVKVFSHTIDVDRSNAVLSPERKDQMRQLYRDHVRLWRRPGSRYPLTLTVLQDVDLNWVARRVAHTDLVYGGREHDFQTPPLEPGDVFCLVRLRPGVAAVWSRNYLLANTMEAALEGGDVRGEE